MSLFATSSSHVIIMVSLSILQHATEMSSLRHAHEHDLQNVRVAHERAVEEQRAVHAEELKRLRLQASALEPMQCSYNGEFPPLTVKIKCFRVLKSTPAALFPGTRRGSV